MEPGNRRIRGLAYSLTDLEAALRTSGRPAGAEGVGIVSRRVASLPADEFLSQSRDALEAVLLGERDLPIELLGALLDTIATIDQMLVEIR